LFFPSTANCRKLKIQKNPKIDFPYCTPMKNNAIMVLFMSSKMFVSALIKLGEL
jgi:hypothetical protein